MLQQNGLLESQNGSRSAPYQSGNWIYRYGSFFEYFTFMERGYREEIIMKSCKYFIGRTSFDRRLIKLLSPGATYFLCEEFIRNEFFMNKWEFPLTKNITCISILKGVTYKGIDLLIDTSGNYLIDIHRFKLNSKFVVSGKMKKWFQ